MPFLLLAVCVFCISGAVSVCCGKRDGLASAFGTGGALAGSVLGLIPAIRSFTGKTDSLYLPWQMPLGQFHIQIDALSGFFLLPILVLSAISAVYGAEYLRTWSGHRRVGISWFFYNLLTASMVLVVIARDGLLFLLAWELMSLASFFLVTFEDDSENSRQAGWVYLIATHLGTAFLLALFVLLGIKAGSLDFDTFSAGAAPAGLLFLLALVGFGTKAGFVPLHVWLPEAHPAAPSHVSAVMSGVMIKTGIYGLIRILTLIGPPPAWWGWTLLVVGAVSGILGVLFAIAQHDLKRLLAYHSVENIGIIALGLGVGLLGISYSMPVLAVLGFAGGLLHVLNHATFKGLLFLGAGSVAHATGTREIDALGGLIKKMPWTAATFLIGAVAISGLPPLNGFVSEFLIYVAACSGVASLSISPAVAGVIVIAGLALIGGLAVACFTKVFGIVFLGEPRSQEILPQHEAGPLMHLAMVMLAAACVAIGLCGPIITIAAMPAVATVSGLQASVVQQQLTTLAAAPLTHVTAVSSVFLLLLVVLFVARKMLLAKRPVHQAGTWDCGYARPTPRMQYTASSFAQPLTNLFRGILRTRHKLAPLTALFPSHTTLHTKTPDIFREQLFAPVFAWLSRLTFRMRWMQHGRLQLYVLYIVVAIVALLFWKMR